MAPLSSPPPTAAASTGPALAALQASFDVVPGYLNAATSGVLPLPAREAFHRLVDESAAGTLDIAAVEAAVTRSRELWARLHHTTGDRVAIGSSLSPMVAVVANSLPPGSEVIVAHNDFSSMVEPFRHVPGLTVRCVYDDRLATSITAETRLVAYSLTQSRNGHVANWQEIGAAAAAHGAQVLCDITQSSGWLDVDVNQFDITVCNAYKWLCLPRSTGFMTLNPSSDLAWLRPVSAAWYACDDMFGSCYGPHIQLSATAKRFDVSPNWLLWPPAAIILELFVAAFEEDPAAIARHNCELANALRDALGQPRPAASGSHLCHPFVTIADPDGSVERRLREAGLRVAARNGAVRITFHIWNTMGDVHAVVAALNVSPS
ncbi:aminotransferase class V-fold PLP-dependent enzyme [Micrococcales bacterium 31B]|nr:aminotransferase class V-fold PLP-dependent enzyme [Micrococcales bacterium 31B]